MQKGNVNIYTSITVCNPPYKQYVYNIQQYTIIGNDVRT